VTVPSGLTTLIGLDVGGSKTAVVEGTLDGVVLQRGDRPTGAGRPFADTWPALAEQIERTIALARTQGRTPLGISVAIGGPLETGEGRLLSPPNLPGWHGVNLRRAISQRFPNLVVFVEHDAKAGALAEYRFGVGAQRPGLQHMVFLTFGTGLGAGIIANGRLVRGANEMAGELWDLTLPAPDHARVREVRGWESVASGRGITALAARMYPARWTIETPTREVVDAALADDPEALEVVRECGRWLGAGLAVLITVLNPQVIVLGTLAVALGNRVLLPAREEVARRTLPRALSACEIVPAALGHGLGDIQGLMGGIEQLAAGGRTEDARTGRTSDH
jgi:glucokinase